METLQLLKQEISQTMESQHDFAKWKLIVVAGLGTAALGLGKENLPNLPHYWLLLFIPFACAYIDLHSYQYQNRIMVIAHFIRDYRPGGAVQGDDAALQAYENLCQSFRKKHIFDLGQYANVAASITLSVVAGLAPWFSPGSAPQQAPQQPQQAPQHMLAMECLWIVGVLLILLLWFYHRFYSLPRIEKLNVPSS